MKSIMWNLQKNNKKQIFVSIITSIMNLIVISVFSMLVVEILNVREQTKVISRDENMMTYLTALIVISLMIILFSLWVIRIVHQSLFHARKEFNIQLRLAGISAKQLVELYMKEALPAQIIVVPIGIVLAEAAFHWISIQNDMSVAWINAPILIGSVMMHLLTITICLAITFRKLVRFDPVEELRSPYKAGRVRKLTKTDLIKGIIGIALILSGLIFKTDDNPLVQFLPLIGAFLIFDLILISVQYILKFIGVKMKILPLYMSHGNTLGNYKKIDPILSTLIVGIMVSIGLMGMFNTARVITRETVEQNVYFQHMIVNEQVKQRMTEEDYRTKIKMIDPNAKVAYGINLEAKDKDDVVNTVFGIDPDYIKYGEKFALTDGTDPTMNLSNENFNGIYLPNYFIPDKDIGSDYKLTLNGHTMNFVVEGRFIANGSRGRYGFVSKAYLQKLMGQADLVNSMYIFEGNEKLVSSMREDPNVLHQTYLEKESIANNSYKNAIKGTEIFQLSSFAVVMISVLMLIHFLTTTSSNNVFDISRFRALGVPSKTLKISYIGQVASIVTQSFLFGTVLAYAFISVGITMVLEYIDVQVDPVIPWGPVLMTYLIVLTVGLVAAGLSIKKAFRPDYTNHLTILN
ncbi:ABC transporter permease [Paenibacillus azoreducens]|uniref:Putative hemin transport system permease protein HrtB n=1 Tax=Paenibacillus azoreducens TaxID=116718 RepID=A0A919YCP6_9BACL|nr:ABC transporter permease [Paenibacillus azoreducens]GIO49206.1 hypothetical protein J34TS1_39710 [Paenibacillus azoreducens]